MSSQDLLHAARERAKALTVRLGDGVTAYHLEGEPGRPCVVLVHGVLTPSYSWEPLSAALVSAGFRVLRYDEYGRGLSDRPPLRYEPALYVRQLHELMEKLELPSAHVVSWSMGSVIASRFALAYPHQVRSLVLIAPGLFVPKPWLLRVVHALPGSDGFIAARVGRFVDALAGQQFREPERFRAFSRRAREQLEFDGIGEAFASTLRHYPWQSGPELAALGQHERPVLVVWGTRDPTTRFANAGRVRALFPRARFVNIERAKHAPHIEHEAEVQPEIVRFLWAAEVG